MNGASVDRAETRRFITRMFGAVNGRQGYVSLRRFPLGRGVPAVTSIPWAGTDHVADHAFTTAGQAAKEALAGLSCATVLPCVLLNNAATARRKDIIAVLGLAFDCDADPAAAEARVVALLGQPSLRVRSGGVWVGPDGREVPKRHLYYVLDKAVTDPADIARVWDAHRAIVGLTGGDTSATLVHPYRYPGSLWRKADANGQPLPPRLVKVMDDNPVTISLTAVLAAADASGAALPSAVTATEPAPGPGTERESDEALVAAVIDGTALHDSLKRLAWRRVQRETDPRSARDMIVLDLRGVLNRSSRRLSDPETWQSRYDDLSRLVDDAVAKQLKQRTLIPADPLTVEVRPGAAFPMAALPAGFRAAVEALARSNEVDPSMAATVALAAASTAVSKLAPGVTAAGLVCPLTLFTAVVVESGGRKTSLDTVVFRGVRRVEADDLATAYRGARRRYEAEVKVYERRVRSILGQRGAATRAGGGAGPDPMVDDIAALAEPVSPRRFTVVTGDTTIEGARDLLAEGHGLLAIVSSEGATLIAGHSLSDRDRRLAAAAGFSAMWDGRTMTVTRAGREICVTDPRVVLALGVQPRIAARFFGDIELRDQGLLSRLLVCWPPSRIGQRTLDPPAPADTATVEQFAATVAARLRAALEVGAGLFGSPPHAAPLPLSPAAEAAWRSFAKATEQNQREGQPYETVRGWASKAAEQALRIAGVLTMFGDPDAVEVPLPVMDAGVALAGWFAGEWTRLSKQETAPPTNTLAATVLKYLRREFGRRGDTFSVRDIYRAGVPGVELRDTAEAVLGLLASSGYIDGVDAPQGKVAGRKPHPKWRLVPAASP
jgi:Protein of unknown function (DUF3987)